MKDFLRRKVPSLVRAYGAIIPSLNFSEDKDTYGNKNTEWISPDGKRRITVSVFKAPEEDALLMKDVRMLAGSEISGSWAEMMRVQVVVNPETQKLEYNVYIDAIQEKEGGWLLDDVMYAYYDGGRVSYGSSGSQPIKSLKYDGLTHSQFRKLYIEDMKKEGLYTISEVPFEIDIEATVSTFIEQIKRKDLSKPLLIPKGKMIGS